MRINGRIRENKEVSKLGWHGFAWAMGPNLRRVVGQALVSAASRAEAASVPSGSKAARFSGVKGPCNI